jgi:hypothetical protein
MPFQEWLATMDRNDDPEIEYMEEVWRFGPNPSIHRTASPSVISGVRWHIENQHLV